MAAAGTVLKWLLGITVPSVILANTAKNPFGAYDLFEPGPDGKPRKTFSGWIDTSKQLYEPIGESLLKLRKTYSPYAESSRRVTSLRQHKLRRWLKPGDDDYNLWDNLRRWYKYLKQKLGDTTTTLLKAFDSFTPRLRDLALDTGIKLTNKYMHTGIGALSGGAMGYILPRVVGARGGYSLAGAILGAALGGIYGNNLADSQNASINV